ncbi:protease pro-enzyme activation domain-containing protein [Dyella sp. S184]|uniref:S53 family peptidase n=1 Tax=Dyella sp. S184 TaxID=1641862 RepID=UPI00131C881B|nr:protease pro-enzyme activation domain-containing protein [Dyella sp. S184]
MKQSYFILSASIAAALAGAPGMLLAQPQITVAAPTGISATEAPRVTQAVTNGKLSTLTKTHLGFTTQAPSTPMSRSTSMNHLQLVLQPSALRTAAMEALIANQHNPKSAQFHKWLTPEQFGEQFGVVDSDIAAATAWLTSQGFTVNNVYPNKTQIDFSGTAAQVNQAFHTQENIYTINNVKHFSNASDISIPAALAPIVAGVMGLNNFHATPLNKKSTSQVGQWDGSKKGFVPKASKNPAMGSKVIGQAIPVGGLGNADRALVPNDMATMYGIKTIRANGVTGKGITIAVVGKYDMVPADWTNFVSQFNLGQYGGTFTQINPAPTSGTNNCVDPSVANFGDYSGTVEDAEWATAIAPGANIEVATCSDYTADFSGYETSNFFGGTFIAATNLVNASSGRPDIISVGYAAGELLVDSASKTAIDLMWAQADAEGISVFVEAGDSGLNPDFADAQINGYGIPGNTMIDVNALASSPHDTAVGGTDLADILDGTTNQYFAATPSVVGGSALSYVPEIAWNGSCGNGVAAKAYGYSSAVAFCQDYYAAYDPDGYYLTASAGSGGPSSVDAKPAWQQQVYNAAKDHFRDIPDVALFAGSFDNYTSIVVCDSYYPCSPGWSTPVLLEESTGISTSMFAGIQALIDQGIAARGLPADQGNAAPTLYALAANEYGGASGPTPTSLASCNADNGATGTSNCVFHNVTRGSTSSNCFEISAPSPGFVASTTPNCYYYAAIVNKNGFVGAGQAGLTTIDDTPTTYGVGNKAYGAQPGWSFASGLGSVNATNLLIAWRAYVGAPPAL